MNIRDLRAKTGLSQRKFGERLGLQGQSILLYEKEERKIPESIQKLIRYEFAEYLPEEERLYPKTSETATEDATAVATVKEENEALKKKVVELERDKEDLRRDKEMLQLHIQTLTGKPGGDQQTA